MKKENSCPACSGTGKMKIVYNEVGGEDENIDFTCVVCKGSGEIGNRVHDAIDGEKGIWCLCPGEKDPYSRYYGDGDHPDLHVHHWRCRKCGKVTGIGIFEN